MEGNGNSQSGFTIKEMLEKQDKKLDKILDEFANLSERVSVHEQSPGHKGSLSNLQTQDARIVVVEKWQERRQGNIDIIKYFFGASAGALVTSILALYASLSGGK